MLGSAMLWATACTGSTGDTQDAAVEQVPPPADDAGETTEPAEDAEGDVVPGDSEPIWSDVLTISDRRYEPDDLLADADRELTIVNEDDEAHTITTFDGTLDVEIGPGERVQIMTPPEPGAFPYSCRFHPEMGGEIDVMGQPRS